MNLDLSGDTPITAAYEFSKERLPGVSFDQFIELFKDWRIVGLHHGHQCAGVVFIKDGFVHICVSSLFRKRWASRRLIKQIISLAAVDGVAKTSVFKNDQFRQRFAERLGFSRVGESGDSYIYEVKDA